MASVTSPRLAHRRALALLFLLALAVRGVIGVWANGRGEMEGLAWRYQQAALALVAGYGLVSPLEGEPAQVDLVAVADSLARHGQRLTPAAVPPRDPARWQPANLHPPGYAWYLSVIYRWAGGGMIAWAKIIQAILDAGACLLVFGLGRRLVSERAGWVASVAYAVFPPLAYLVTSRVADALMPGFYVVILALLVRGLATRRLLWYAAAGVMLGLACLLRPDNLLLPSFLLVGALLMPRDRGWAALGIAVLTGVTLLVLLPWGLYNQRVSGTFQLTSTAGGMSLYQSIGQFPNPYGVIFEDAAMADSARAAGFRGVEDPAANRYFARRFMTIARQNPGLLIGHMMRRVPLGIAPLYRWGYVNAAYPGHNFYEYTTFEHLSAYQSMLRHPRELLAAYWDRLIFGLIGLGLFVGGAAILVADRRRHVAFLLLLPYPYLVLSHLPLMLGARLLVPGVFGQFIVLGCWYERLVRREPVALREI
jgi:hypothetical protein